MAFELPLFAIVVGLAALCIVARCAAARALTHALSAYEQLASRELTLARSEERLRLAQEVAHVGTWDVCLLDGETTWSQSMREIMGVEDGPASYEAFRALVHPEDRPRVVQTISDAVSRGAEYEFECRLCRPNGQIRWVMARGSVISDQEGTPIRKLGVTMDISARKDAEREREALEQQLHEAQRLEAVGRLAGGVAHDFHDVLLGVRGYGELALRALGRGEDADEEVEEMLAGVDRAVALTRQLVAFSRTQIQEPEIVDLNEVVLEMKKLLERLIGDEVALEAVVAPAPVLVKADRGQLERVIANLAVNARDAMSDGGRVTLAVGATELGYELPDGTGPGRFAVLTVSDTGPGMEAETASHIFEPFFTTNHDRSGLGLATVHGIVKQSGGSISVRTQPGHGTIFRMRLPLAE